MSTHNNDSAAELEDEDWLCEHHDDGHILEREWNARRNEFYVSGMREGYEAGKEETVQQGFDQGFKLGAQKGYEWGCVKGAVAAVQALAQSTQTPVDDMESVRLLTHDRIKKQVCGSLYSLYGEMKDRFPEHDEEGVRAMAEKQNSDKVLAEESLARSGIDIQRVIFTSD